MEVAWEDYREWREREGIGTGKWHITQTTFDNYSQRYSLHIAPKFCKVRLRNLITAHVQEWLGKLEPRGNRRHVRATFFAILERANAMGISTIPLPGRRLPWTSQIIRRGSFQNRTQRVSWKRRLRRAT